MKVLIVYPRFYVYGGGETLIVKLCNYLTKQGIKNAILTTEMIPEIENDLDDTKVFVKTPKMISFKRMYKALKQGVKELENEYDVLNPHNFPADLACATSKNKKIWMCNEPEAYLLLNDQRFKGSNQYKNIVFAFKVQKFLYRFLMKKAVVADEFNAQRFKKLFGYEPKIINYGVDYNFFSTEPEQQKIDELKEQFKDRFIVLQSGMMQPLKNQIASLETINELKDKIPNILLILTGAMLDTEYEGRLRKYVEENNLENYVYFKGHVNRTEVREFYNISNVLLHPIKPQGGWLTPFEFLSAGRPIVVSEEFPPKRILLENNIGTVTCEYAAAIMDVYQNPQNHIYMAQKGKEFVKKNLQWENFCANMLDYFKS
jgi:glycosyltransferase involved in cell wall biosynthesis